MLRIRQIKIDVTKANIDNIKREVAHKLRININDIIDLKINKESIDARKKPQISYIYEVDCSIKNEDYILKTNNSIDIFKTPNEEYTVNVTGTKEIINRPIIVGAGPAGLFAALNLARMGYKPLIIERGESIPERKKTVNLFWETNKLNPNSNIQFGEGGAGTFSDGKLNTMVKDPDHRCKEVFRTFVRCGADPKILYVNKPHIGTDVLEKVIVNLRNEIIHLGGEIRYNTCLTNIYTNNNEITKIEVNNEEIIDTNLIVLAIGHSARDTFYMLKDKLTMEPKPFAVGVRISHPQTMINKSQYGIEKHSILENADYKLTYQTKEKRGVYTFCMCPGGYVVNSSSEANMLAINGMSYSKRDSINANSAVLVTITPKDFGNDVTSGIEFQRQLETKAYNIGKGFIPIQLFKDYKNNVITKSLGEVEPLFKGNYTLSNLNDIFPDYINSALKEGIDAFGLKIKGFNRDDAILAGVESRTSSPLKIIRDEELISNITGLYPCGEGAGYAGGITSASMDGLRVSEAIMMKYHN